MALTNEYERVDAESDLYDMQISIRDTCFKNDDVFTVIPLRWMPAGMAEKQDSPAVYRDGCILIDKVFYKAHGTDNAMIRAMYHEILHTFCAVNDIHDTDGTKHLEAFADVCERHGGFCSWVDSQHGYSNISLKTKNLKRIKRMIQSMKGA